MKELYLLLRTLTKIGVKIMRPQPMNAAAAVAAACCAAASTTLAFQAAAPPPPLTMKMKLHGASLSPIDDDQVDDIIDMTANDLHGNVLFSEGPRALGPKRTFLGLRRESGIMRRMLMEQQSQQQSAGASTTTKTALASSATALMPDGGLSPCVIKVLGVGGGGSNAVRLLSLC